MEDLKLSRLLLPYLLRDENLASHGAILSNFSVASWKSSGNTIEGRCKLSESVKVGPDGFQAEVSTGNAIMLFKDLEVDFKLASVEGTSLISRQDAGEYADLFDACGYPDSGFVLDIIFYKPYFRPEFLRPAMLGPEGALVEHDTLNVVEITLPELTLRLVHETTLSLGIPLGQGGEVSMTPPFAFIGTSDTIGIGFEKAALDLSDEETPSDLVPKDWHGVYIEKASIFVSGAGSFAFNAGVEKVLIGFGGDVWGNFEASFVNTAGGLSRQPPQVQQTTPTSVPTWLTSVTMKVKIVKSEIVYAELECDISVKDAIDERFDGGILPASSEKIVKMMIMYQDGGDTVVSIKSDERGIVSWEGNDNIPLTIFGSFITFWPVLANTVGNGISDSNITGEALGVPTTIASMTGMRVKKVTLYGASFVKKGSEYSVLFDVGTEWTGSLAGIVTVGGKHPMCFRYKAIGVRIGSGFSIAPVFDGAQGYTLDLGNAGAFSVGEPLGSVLDVLGSRISKKNPIALEVDLGMNVDLGVVSVDRASLRVFLDRPDPPELTAFGVTVDVPGAITGSGYVKLSQGVLKGQIDLTLPSLRLRVCAAVSIEKIQEGSRSGTGVYVSIGLDFPVGFPIGTTGLGIFGFRALFGMHYQRAEIEGGPIEWYKAAGGDPSQLKKGNVDLWKAKIDQWAFGAGIRVGTMEGGYVLNMLGTLLFELPGPRLALVLDAELLKQVKALAVIELTPDYFFIGVVMEWDIKRLIKIIVPLDALFPLKPTVQGDEDPWHIYLGARSDYGHPVEVDVLGIVKGTGYLMFRRGGFRKKDSLEAVSGFSIGIGVAASFLWGNTDVGLYLRVGGGMDAVVGFEPFVMSGRIYVHGELRLFIVSIGASAELTVSVKEQGVYVHGWAEASVKILFVRISGRVEVEIGKEGELPQLSAPNLVKEVSLKSRSPALLQGTATDRGIDTVLGKATPTDSGAVVVPIDSIIVISLEMPAQAAKQLMIEGLNIPVPTPPYAGKAKRGSAEYEYVLTKVAIERLSDDGKVITDGIARAVWLHVDNPETSAQLALFTNEPFPFAKAMTRSPELDSLVSARLQKICWGAAPASEVMWFFKWEKTGGSASGWDLEGIAWPDPDETRRGREPDTTLHVHEYATEAQALVYTTKVQCDSTPSSSLLLVNGHEVPTSDPVHPMIVNWTIARPVTISSKLYDKVKNKPSMLREELMLKQLGLPSYEDQGRMCTVRMLVAPTSDKVRGLHNVVALDIGPYQSVTILIRVSRQLVKRGIFVVRAVNKDDDEVLSVVARAEDFERPLPERWTSEGPWAANITDILNATGGGFLSHSSESNSWLTVIMPKQPDAAKVEIGLTENSNARTQPYFIGAFSAVRYEEVERSFTDITTSSADATVLNDVLGKYSEHSAMMIPNSTYKITVNWNNGGEHVSWFRTDDASSNLTLEPWVMFTIPEDVELHCFYEEKSMIVFNTPDVDHLLKQYKQEMRVHYRSSLSDQDEPPVVVTLEMCKAKVLSPWEEAASNVLKGMSCIQIDEERYRHSYCFFNTRLKPNMNYIMDVELVGYTPSAYRRHFSTGAYSSFESFAAAMSVKPVGKYVSAGLLQDMAAEFIDRDPMGSELDEHMSKCGIPLVSPGPKVTILWTESLLPAAVLVDSLEPLWRERSYFGAKQLYMWLSDASGLVTKVIRFPGWHRAIFMLNSNARGSTLKIDFRKVDPSGLLNTTENQVRIIDYTLDRAPWEE